MNKALLHQAVIMTLESELNVARQAAIEARDTAIHKEAKAENKYDTFGLEAAYLAEGQSKRVQQAEHALSVFRRLPVRYFSENDAIAYGAYVELTTPHNVVMKLFISPVGGGCLLDHAGERIALLTPDAPLGKRLMGAFLDDDIVINQQSCRITQIS